MNAYEHVLYQGRFRGPALSDPLTTDAIATGKPYDSPPDQTRAGRSKITTSTILYQS